MENGKQLVHTSRIVVDERFQVRARTDDATVERYANAMKAGSTFPPIKLAQIGSSLVLIDGFHRLRAGIADAEGFVEAVVVAATQREARWLAAEANAQHGLPLKPNEIREAFRAYVRARKHTGKSYREMSKDFLGGVKPHNTIIRWMHKDFPEIARKIGGDEGRATGGLQEHEAEWTPMAAAIEGLSSVRAAFAGITDAQDRGAVLVEMTAMLTELLRELEGWTPPDF